MASSFAQGFVTGFANTLAKGMEERQESARRYFEKQLEIAQTKGVENRRRVTAIVDQNVSVANQLMAMGVPKDIVMAQASMNPESLPEFYKEVEELRLKSPEVMTEDTYRALYNISGTFKAPEEDFRSFFSRMYEPAQRAAKEDPEGFKSDREGSIWGRVFSSTESEYGKAQDRLRNTPVADGMSAADLIAYGDDIYPQAGGAVVTRNPEAFRRVAAKDDGVSFAIRNQIVSAVEEAFSTKMVEVTKELGESGENTEAVVEKAILAVADELGLDGLKGNERELALRELRRNADRILKASDSTKGGEDAPETAEVVVPPEVKSEVVIDEADTDPIVIRDAEGVRTLTFMSDNKDGTLTFLDQRTGKQLVYPVDQFRELRKTYGG